MAGTEIIHLPPSIQPNHVEELREILVAEKPDIAKLESLFYYFLLEDNFTPEVCLIWALQEAEAVGVDKGVISPVIEKVIAKTEAVYRIENEAEDLAKEDMSRLIKKLWGRYMSLVISGQFTQAEVIALIHGAIIMAFDVEPEDIGNFLTKEKLI